MKIITTIAFFILLDLFNLAYSSPNSWDKELSLKGIANSAPHEPMIKVNGISWGDETLPLRIYPNSRRSNFSTQIFKVEIRSNAKLMLSATPGEWKYNFTTHRGTDNPDGSCVKGPTNCRSAKLRWKVNGGGFTHIVGSGKYTAHVPKNYVQGGPRPPFEQEPYIEHQMKFEFCCWDSSHTPMKSGEYGLQNAPQGITLTFSEAL